MCISDWHLTGKTVTTIGSELVNLNEKKLDKCIFCCTKASLGEVLNDYNKFYDFTPMQLNSFASVRLFFESNATVAVTRYEWLKYLEPEYLSEQSKQHHIGIWWDEAQKLKNGSKDRQQKTGTVVHRKAKELRQFCEAFHLVTATPIMSSLDDLWALMHLVDPAVLGSYSQFANNFYERELVPHPTKRWRKMRCPKCGCDLVYRNGWDICINPCCQAIETPQGYVPYRRQVQSIWNVIEYKNLDVLSQLLQKNMICYFPRQNIHYVEHTFELNQDTERAYYRIAKDIIEKEDKEEEDTPFSTRLIELQYVVDRSWEKRFELYKVVKSVMHKGFVLYIPLYDTCGKHDSNTTLDYVKAVLDTIPGLEYRAYTGKEKDEEKDENKKWFQANPKNKCLIISRAGGASLNLQCTNEFVFYGMPDGFGAISQALGRVVRLFSTYKEFNIHFIIGEHSVDRYKHTTFLMYEEVLWKLLNNQLIGSDKLVKFNSKVKEEMRKYLLWRSDNY